MGFTQSITSIGLGGIMAWLILMIFQVKKTTSYYMQLRPWPLEENNSNLALIGVGLASAKPTSSVMDATPSSPQVMIMTPAPAQVAMVETQSPTPPQSPEVVHIAVPASVTVPLAPSPTPMAMSPSPTFMGSPVTLTPQSASPSPSA